MKALSTGLLYLCKTSSSNKDPYTYKGSGKYWLKHLNKHNPYIVTCILGEYETKEQLTEAGLFYSKMYNVVEDKRWANLTEEKGDGGLIGQGQLGKRWKVTTQGKENMKTSRIKLWKNRGKSLRKAQGERFLGAKNHQFTGWILTPWGRFASLKEATECAKILRKQSKSSFVISDHATLKKYIENLDVPLNKEGRRTPRTWRQKTPREIGFDKQYDK